MAADRSTRAEMPVAEAGQTVHVVADGTDGRRRLLRRGHDRDPSKAGVYRSIDRVTMEHNGGEEPPASHASRARHRVHHDRDPLYETEREDAEARGTEGRAGGAAGSEATGTYQETDGNATVSAVLSTTRTEPTKRIVAKGTKAEEKTEDTSSTRPPSGSSDSSSSGSSASAHQWSPVTTLRSRAAIAQCESGGNPSLARAAAATACAVLSARGVPSVARPALRRLRGRNRPCVRACSSNAPGWGQWGLRAYKLGLV